MHRYAFGIMMILLSLRATAQADSSYADTTSVKSRALEEVTVTAYNQQRNLYATPAAINSISQKDLACCNNVSLLPVLNNTPGIRMEERSPGSYRLSIRGSSLRSPFGVRNVKIYYNDIPVTDPGGLTYLNALGFYSVSDIQVIKGPGSSAYGAGNGGVMLISSRAADTNSISLGFSGGSYGQHNAFIRTDFDKNNRHSDFGYEYQASDGYRDHSAISKHVVTANTVWQLNHKTELDAHLLYNHLYYETPGALTFKEYNADPRSARPDAGSIPGAVTQQAAIYQDDALAGVSLRHRFDSSFRNTTTVYGLFSQLNNPAIRNYSKTTDPHFGVRTVFNYDHTIGEIFLKMAAGAEAQQSLAVVKTYANAKGTADSLMSNNRINSSDVLGFAQATMQYKKWVFETGISVSSYQVLIKPENVFPAVTYKTAMYPVSPRFALLYRLQNAVSFYVNVARGYSPPATDELAPSGSAINLQLRPEYGWNYEAGMRGTVLQGKLFYDASVFYYKLIDAIVTRKDSLGGDYYTNAGSTKQKGLEVQLKYHVFTLPGFIRAADVHAGLAVYDFRYRDFRQEDKSYSGNRLPGVAPQTVSAQLDVYAMHGLTLSLNYYYSAEIALDDGNTAYARPYHLLSAKMMYTCTWRKFCPQLFAGADNILGQVYSLGNDINAAGGRYYNAAPGFSIYAGMSVKIRR